MTSTITMVMSSTNTTATSPPLCIVDSNGSVPGQYSQGCKYVLQHSTLYEFNITALIFLALALGVLAIFIFYVWHAGKFCRFVWGYKGILGVGEHDNTQGTLKKLRVDPKTGTLVDVNNPQEGGFWTGNLGSVIHVPKREISFSMLNMGLRIAVNPIVAKYANALRNRSGKGDKVVDEKGDQVIAEDMDEFILKYAQEKTNAITDPNKKAEEITKIDCIRTGKESYILNGRETEFKESEQNDYIRAKCEQFASEKEPKWKLVEGKKHDRIAEAYGIAAEVLDGRVFSSFYSSLTNPMITHAEETRLVEYGKAQRGGVDGKLMTYIMAIVIIVMVSVIAIVALGHK